jgi:hypothetical protein
MMRRLAALWDGYWFAPASPLPLGICRALTCAWFFRVYAGRDFAGWGDVPPVFWMPTHAFALLGLPLASAATLEWFHVFWLLSLALGAIGLLTRGSTALACVLGFYLTGLAQCFGKINHNDTVVPLLLMVLAMSRCGDAFSVDAWLATRRAARAGGKHERPASGAYTWPIRAVWLLTGLVFFAAGLSKLRNGGLAWITGDNMRHILLKHHYPGFAPVTRIGLVLAEHAWITKPMAAFGMGMELLALQSAPVLSTLRVVRALGCRGVMASRASDPSPEAESKLSAVSRAAPCPGTTQVPVSLCKHPSQVPGNREGRPRALRVRVPSAPPQVALIPASFFAEIARGSLVVPTSVCRDRRL